MVTRCRAHAMYCPSNATCPFILHHHQDPQCPLDLQSHHHHQHCQEPPACPFHHHHSRLFLLRPWVGGHHSVPGTEAKPYKAVFHECWRLGAVHFALRVRKRCTIMQLGRSSLQCIAVFRKMHGIGQCSANSADPKLHCRPGGLEVSTQGKNSGYFRVVVGFRTMDSAPLNTSTQKLFEAIFKAIFILCPYICLPSLICQILIAMTWMSWGCWFFYN